MTKRDVLLQALASTPADVGRLVRGLDAAAADWRGAGWSCHDVVAHLVYLEPLYQERLRRVLTEERPAVPYLHPNPAAHDHSRTIAQLAERFGDLRGQTLAALRAIGPGDWQRPAVHETSGLTTLRFLVQGIVDHDIEHTSQLVEILGQLRAERRRDANAPGVLP